MAGMVKVRGQQGGEQAQTGRREGMQRHAGWDPFRGFGMMDPLRRMREMLAGEPFPELESMMTGERAFTPELEVRESKDAYTITADLPGIKESDLSIDVSGQRLVISGKREEEQREEGERCWVYERSYGSFSRSFVLPEGVEPDKIDARLDKGVLQVRIPKSQAEQPKRISIKSGASQQGQTTGTHGTSQTQAPSATTGATQGGSREKAA